MTPAPRDQDRFLQAKSRLQAEAVKALPDYPRSTQDEFDIQHVAAAISGDLNVFVTLDAELTKIFGPQAARLGMRILRPADVVVRVDELARAESYRPIDLQDTSYSERLIGSGEDEVVQVLANVSAGERPKALIRSARQLAVAGGERMGVFGPTGELVAYYGVSQSGVVLLVTTLRVTDGYVGETLIRQLLFRLRHLARDRSATVLVIDSALKTINGGGYRRV